MKKVKKTMEERFEKEMKEALILTHDDPIEVIFSGGVSKTIRAIPWSLLVKAFRHLTDKELQANNAKWEKRIKGLVEVEPGVGINGEKVVSLSWKRYLDLSTKLLNE